MSGRGGGREKSFILSRKEQPVFFLQVESDICDLKKGLVFYQFVPCGQPETNLILSGLADSRTFNV